MSKSAFAKSKPVRFFVTALGEMLRGDDLLSCGTVNISALATRLGLRRPLNSTGEVDSLRWKEIVELEFRQQMRAQLTDREYAFATSVHSLQELFNDGRFRIYGGFDDPDGPDDLRLVTEFIAFVDDPTAWEAIRTARSATSASICTLTEHPHMDHSWRLDKDGNRTDEKFGPDHDRIERQVEFSWKIRPDITPAELKRRIIHRAAVTQKVWDSYGVGVL